MTKHIAIIGAGIAGLAAGCYAQMNGYTSEIFELHTLPGGLCTSWKRNGYTYDGCIHWLVGSNPSSMANVLWRELGVAQGRAFVEHDEFVRFTAKDGKTLILYTDPDRLEEHMKALAPDDAKLIETFTGGIRALGGVDMPIDPPRGLQALTAGVKMLPALPIMRKYRSITIAEFFGQFKDPFLRDAFPRLWGLAEMPVLIPMMTFAMMHRHNAGYPVGGSLSVAQAIEARYLALGGKVNYKSPVARIIVESKSAGDRATGVRLADGAEHGADIVLSAADGHKTIFEMLDSRYADAAVRMPYEKWAIFQPIVQVSLGVRRDLAGLPPTASWEIDSPVVVGGEERRDIGMRHFCYDPTLAPAGKSVVTGMFPSNYAFWERVAAEPERYEAEKKNAGIVYIEQLDRRFPGLAADVEAVDVATPLTWERYTGNWQGSIEGWMMNRDTMGLAFGKGMSKTLPGLADFYMAGQWVEPGGGVPTAAISGRNVLKLLCKADGRRFEASET